MYHHQTCQAKFDGGRGRIGKLSEGDKIIANLKDMLENKQMPVISCPKHTCGCGLCAPKSKFEDKFLQTLNDHIDIGVLDVNNRQQ